MTYRDTLDEISLQRFDTALASAASAMKTDALLAEIRRLQDVQKRNAPTTDAWQNASDELAPLFAEMARREPPHA